MKLSEIISEFNLTVGHLPETMDPEIVSGFSSDLLSHVVGYAESGQIWLTCQMHRNIIAVAVLKEIPAIVLVNSNEPVQKELLAVAEKEHIAVLSAPGNAFELAGRMYGKLNQSSAHAH